MSGWAGSSKLWADLLDAQARDHGRLFFRLAYGVVRDVAAAEDACQQAMLKAWTQRDAIDDPRTLRAWLCRTVVNESLMIARRLKIERRVLNRHATIAETSSGAPETIAGREAVLIAMGQLDEEVRAVVALRIIEGLSGNEVKELMGCSAAGVSRRLHQGLAQLRNILHNTDQALGQRIAVTP